MVDKLVPRTELEETLKFRATSAEDRYKILEARDKLLRLLIKDVTNLGIGFRMRGSCPDMCPEKERLFRDAKHQISVFELCAKDGVSLDHNRAVKQYTRSSANQESPLAHEVRPESVLRLTMDYLINEIMDKLENLSGVHIGEWYHFLWDRTRSVRKDIIQQELCSTQTVFLVEECARFHIHCAARLVAEEPAVFDQKINTENLTKCLQTLKYMYNDLRLKNIHCANESEFRGYIVLLNLNDSNFLSDIKVLSVCVRNSQEIKFALEVAKAVANNNYVRFFTLVKQTSYLNACILLRYFTQIRLTATRTIMKSYHWPRSVGVPVVYLHNLLAFENVKCCTCFFEEYGLRIVSNKVMLDRRLFRSNQQAKTFERALNIVESKLQSSVGQVVYGKSALKRNIDDHVALSSFDSNGYLKEDAFDVHECLKYLKKKNLTTTKNKFIIERPIRLISNTKLDGETGNFLARSEHGLIGNKNPHFLNSLQFDSAKHVMRDKSFLDEKRTLNDSYDKMEVVDFAEASFAACGNMIFQEQESSGSQPWIENLCNRFSPEKKMAKSSLDFNYQLSDLRNSLKSSMNDISGKFNMASPESGEMLNHNQKIVEDIIISHVFSTLEQLSKYELAKSEEIRQKSVIELEHLIDGYTLLQVPRIAYDQLNIFKKIKVSKLMEAPSSWISDNILSEKYTIDLSDKLFMQQYKIAKSNEKSRMSISPHLKSFSMPFLSEFLSIPNRLKIVVSFPDICEANEKSAYLLKCYATIENGDENYVLTKNFSDKYDDLHVCLLKMVGPFPSNQSAVEYSNNNAFINSVIFFMTLTNTTLAEKRLHSLLGFLQNTRAIPVHLIVCDFNAVSGVKRHTSQLDNFILKSCFLNHTVNFCHVKENLSDVFINSLKYMFMGEYAHTELEMHDTRSFLCNVLGSHLWKRISEASFVCSSFRQYCTDPYRIMRLYNEALNRVCILLSNREEGTEDQGKPNNLYFNETLPKKRALFLWKNNSSVIRFIERLNLNAANYDFSSFEYLKQSIEKCCMFSTLPPNFAVKVVNNVLQHFPDNFTVKTNAGKRISWIEIVRTIALEMLDSNWIIYSKDLPAEVVYQKSVYNYIVSNAWWGNVELLSNSENTSVTLDAFDYRKERTEHYEGKSTSKEVQKISRALKRKGLYIDTSQSKKEKNMLDYYWHRIFKEEIELRNCESIRSLKNEQRCEDGFSNGSCLDRQN